jgi:glycosyltransferase involved in cell wall biosynthesis
MKVALVCNKFYPNIGGVETVVFELAKNLSSLGVDVTVLTLTDNSQLPKIELCENFRVLRFREFGLNNIKISFGLIKHLRKMSRNYDLIHVHNYHTFPAFIAALFSNNRFVFSPHYHGTGQTLFTKILHYPYWLLGAYIFAKADKVICDTDAEATLVKSHFKFVTNIQVIPLAINVKGLHDAKKINYGSEYILTVGRLENYKNIDLIIQSLTFLPKNLKLIIVGYGSQLNYLKQLIENLKLTDRVSIINRIRVIL